MKGCVWKRMLQTMNEFPKPKLGRLYQSDTEESLLQAIKEETVFGFVVADVRSDDSLIMDHVHNQFLFPPVVTRRNLTMDHLSPYMQQQYTEARKQPKETVIQTYHGDQVVLLTAMVQFYMEHNIKVQNITKFVQFEAGCALKPFTEKVTSMRIEAATAGDEAKGLTGKLMGNSGKPYEPYDMFAKYLLRVRKNGRGADKIQHHKDCNKYGRDEKVYGQANFSQS